MTRHPRKTDPTDLEAAVLGILCRDGPCTTYAVRRHFLDSPAPRWSGSAGAIYPLVRRLESAGLLVSKPGASGKRSRRDYRITRSGLAVLRRWLRSSSPADSALPHDPLRTRMQFLEALPAAAATAFVTEVLETLTEQLASLERRSRRGDEGCSRFERFADRNAVLLTRARIRWLKEVREVL